MHGAGAAWTRKSRARFKEFRVNHQCIDLTSIEVDRVEAVSFTEKGSQNSRVLSIGLAPLLRRRSCMDATILGFLEDRLLGNAHLLIVTALRVGWLLSFFAHVVDMQKHHLHVCTHIGLCLQVLANC